MTPLTSSEISCFQRCEREWEYRYVGRRDGLVPADALTRGTRVHKVLNVLWGSYSGRIAAIESLPPAEHAMLTGYWIRWGNPHLSNIRVNVPWRAKIEGVEMCGELDVLGSEIEGGVRRWIIVEHKSTSSDITPGSMWWREKVTTDLQLSAYQYAFPGARVLVDVLKVPMLRQYEAGKTRKVAETDDEYVSRCLEDMSEKPEKYFHRAFVVRLEEEHRAFAYDIRLLASRMATRLEHPRNPRSCFAYGRACDFFAVCWEGKRIEDYPQREQNHSEEVAARCGGLTPSDS